MKTSHFRFLMVIAGVYHVFLAVVGLFLPAEVVVKILKISLGVVLNQDHQFDLVVRFSSAYLLAFGSMLLLLARDPIKHRVLAIPALILFGARIINRVILFNALLDAGMTQSRNVTGIILLLIFAASLLWFVIRHSSRDMNHAATKLQ
jgi:hypothetical protein